LFLVLLLVHRRPLREITYICVIGILVVHPPADKVYKKRAEFREAGKQQALSQGMAPIYMRGLGP